MTRTGAEIERARLALIQRHGTWTAANVDLGDGVYTIGPEAPTLHAGMVRFAQLFMDYTGKALAALRILDLACLEGEYAIEFARQGAQVVGIEGRAANIAKARFAKDALDLGNLDLIQDDVRNLRRENHGAFDAVLCSGILYHLDAPDVAEFLYRIGEVCDKCLIVDTHVAFRGRESFEHRGSTYWGSRFVEHHRAATERERESSSWASLDNRTSFWFTRPSLLNALHAAGFTSVAECHSPPHPEKSSDRLTLVAIKGQPYRPTAVAAARLPVTWSERQTSNVPYYAKRFLRSVVLSLPHALSRRVSALLTKRRT
jgi:SAM-dependent methyltransferase